jgi:hypothetical protein
MIFFLVHNMTFNSHRYFRATDELRRATTSFQFRIAVNMLCYRCNVWIYFCLHITWLETGCVHSSDMPSCDMLRRVVTSFEFRIAVKNIYIDTNVMIEIFCRHNIWLETWMCVFVWRDELQPAATGCDELWISYCSKNICFLQNKWRKFLVDISHDLKSGWVFISCGMTSCNVARRAVTSFEFRIAVKNICCITDVMIFFLCDVVPYESL